MYIPVFLEAQNLKIMVVGGGKVALRKIQPLLAAGASITVLSESVHPEIEALNPCPVILRQPYRECDLSGFHMVLAVTNDDDLNRQICALAREKGILELNGSDGLSGTVTFPAVQRIEDITVAISTNGGSPASARAVAAQCAENIERQHWPERVRILKTVREMLKNTIQSADERKHILQELSELSLEELELRRKDHEDSNRNPGQQTGGRSDRMGG